jgi:hypothetical protein
MVDSLRINSSLGWRISEPVHPTLDAFAGIIMGNAKYCYTNYSYKRLVFENLRQKYRKNNVVLLCALLCISRVNLLAGTNSTTDNPHYTSMTNIWEMGEETKRSFSTYCDLLRNKLYYWAVAIKTPLADPRRHIKKKQLRDISNKIRRVQLRMHNRKAKCYIPELLVELNSLFKQRDTIRNGFIMRTQHTPKPQKICSVCNYRIDKGYHICKPHSSRPLQS